VSEILVSIVVPVYNGEKYLKKTIASILEQSYSNFELLLINDGSRDSSAKLIDALVAADKRIKGFSKENGGVANARNYGVSLAKGKLIAFCDQDDLWLPDKLEKQLPLFENPNVGLVYCGAVVEALLYGKISKGSLANKQRGYVFDQLVQLNMLTCCTAVVRKKHLLKAGGFDDDLALMGVDDWHLWLKMSLICEFDFVPEHLAVHVFHGDNYSCNDEKMHQAELVCLAKIKAFATQFDKTAQWADIIQNLHIRYAQSYVTAGLFNLAGDTFMRAHQTRKNSLFWAKGYMLKLVPDFFWKGLQNAKRATAK
jgi:glycosyltransferase involved in cell wall biosynthesis